MLVYIVLCNFSFSILRYLILRFVSNLVCVGCRFWGRTIGFEVPFPEWVRGKISLDMESLSGH